MAFVFPASPDALTLASGDILYILDSQFIAATGAGADAITAMGGNNSISIFGDVIANDIGISYAGANTSIFVDKEGSVFSALGSAISHAGTSQDTYITNHGIVLTNGGASPTIFLATGGVIFNSGRINNAGLSDQAHAIDLGLGTGPGYVTTITNIGTIDVAGASTAILGSDLTGSAEVVVNDGVIRGDVVLRGGNDQLTSLGTIRGNVDAGDGDDVISVGVHAGTVYGGNGNDVLKITGSGGILDGGAGYNALYAGFNTVMLGGTGTLNFLTGTDFASNVTVDYGAQSASVQVNLELHVGNVANVTRDTIYRVQNITGGSASDVLTGDTNSNVFVGGLGYDVLDGNGIAGFAPDTFKYNAIAESSLGGLGYDTIIDFRTGFDRIDLTALHTTAQQTQIFSGGGNTALYTFNAGTGEVELAISFIGNNVLTVADVMF